MSPDPRFREAAAAWLAAFGADGVDPDTLDVPFAPTTHKAVLDGALAFGRAAGRLPAAMRVLAEGEARLQRLRGRLGLGRADRAGEALPSVVVVERADPLTLAGRWVPDLVTHAGGRPVRVAAGQPPFVLALDALAAAAPDRVLATSEDAMALGLRDAVGSDRVLVYEGPPLDCPGPDLVDAVEALATLLHPDRFVEPEGVGGR